MYGSDAFEPWMGSQTMAPHPEASAGLHREVPIQSDLVFELDSYESANDDTTINTNAPSQGRANAAYFVHGNHPKPNAAYFQHHQAAMRSALSPAVQPRVNTSVQERAHEGQPYSAPVHPSPAKWIPQQPRHHYTAPPIFHNGGASLAWPGSGPWPASNSYPIQYSAQSASSASSLRSPVLLAPPSATQYGYMPEHHSIPVESNLSAIINGYNHPVPQSFENTPMEWSDGGDGQQRFDTSTEEHNWMNTQVADSHPAFPPSSSIVSNAGSLHNAMAPRPTSSHSYAGPTSTVQQHSSPHLTQDTWMNPAGSNQIVAQPNTNLAWLVNHLQRLEGSSPDSVRPTSSNRGDSQMFSPINGGPLSEYGSGLSSPHYRNTPYSPAVTQDPDMQYRLNMGIIEANLIPSVKPQSLTMPTVYEDHIAQQPLLMVLSEKKPYLERDSARRDKVKRQENLASSQALFGGIGNAALRTSIIPAAGQSSLRSPASGLRRQIDEKRHDTAAARHRAPYAFPSSSPTASGVASQSAVVGRHDGQFSHHARMHSWGADTTPSLPSMATSVSPNQPGLLTLLSQHGSVSSYNTISTPANSFPSTYAHVYGSYNSDGESIPAVSVIVPDSGDGDPLANSLGLEMGQDGIPDSLSGVGSSSSYGSTTSPIRIPGSHSSGSVRQKTPVAHIPHIVMHQIHNIGQNREGKISVDYDLINRSFRSDSPTSLRRRVILDKILNEPWFRDNLPEPDISGLEDDPLVGRGLLTGISSDDEHGHGLDFALRGGEELGVKGKSVYRVFLKSVDKKWVCLFGSGENGRFFCPKSADGFSKPERAVEHIRSHLGHRPFWCNNGCEADPPCNWKFFARGHVVDHQKKPHRRIQCTDCGESIRQGNLQRHLETHR